MGVGTNLGRKSIAGSKSCRSVVAGAPLSSPGGGGGGGGVGLEEGAEQEERKKKWGEGEKRKAIVYLCLNGRRCGRRPLV